MIIEMYALIKDLKLKQYVCSLTAIFNCLAMAYLFTLPIANH